MPVSSEAQQIHFGGSAAQRKTIHDLRNLFAIVGAAKSLLERDPASARRDELLRAIGDGLTFPTSPGIGSGENGSLSRTPEISGERPWKTSICSCSETSLPN